LEVDAALLVAYLDAFLQTEEDELRVLEIITRVSQRCRVRALVVEKLLHKAKEARRRGFTMEEVDRQKQLDQVRSRMVEALGGLSGTEGIQMKPKKRVIPREQSLQWLQYRVKSPPTSVETEEQESVPTKGGAIKFEPPTAPSTPKPEPPEPVPPKKSVEHRKRHKGRFRR
jgi:hypothetical protein